MCEARLPCIPCIEAIVRLGIAFLLALTLIGLAAACNFVTPAADIAVVTQEASESSTALPTQSPFLTSSPHPAVKPSAPVTVSTAEPTACPTDQPTPSLTAEPTACSTDQPTPSLTAELTAQPPTPSPISGPAAWEQAITLNTYGWREALVATDPGDAIYPYPRLDFDAVTGPAPREYQAIFIQNSYVQLVVVPELGGRILRWTDLTTGRQLFYANPVIKPTRWGYRGWWLATGGMEWAFPEQEHGLNEYRPWQYELLWNGVRVWDTEDRTGMTVEVTIQLDDEHNYFTLTPRITNLTEEPHPYQFWANSMLSLSDYNTPSPDLTFILPDDAVTVHSTGDGGLPNPGGQMTWPVHGGRDFSRYGEWHQYLGVFANPAQAGFVGAYDLSSDQGIVRVFPHTVATGVKIFCMGDLSSSLWTDDSSRYFELWAGLTPTFWDYWTLQPGASVTWSERWYPVSGIGGYNWANEETAIRLVHSDDSAEVAVATSRAMNGTVLLRRGGAEVQRWDALIAPGQPFHAAVGPVSTGGDWGVQVIEGGVIVAEIMS